LATVQPLQRLDRRWFGIQAQPTEVRGLQLSIHRDILIARRADCPRLLIAAHRGDAFTADHRQEENGKRAAEPETSRAHDAVSRSEGVGGVKDMEGEVGQTLGQVGDQRELSNATVAPEDGQCDDDSDGEKSCAGIDDEVMVVRRIGRHPMTAADTWEVSKEALRVDNGPQARFEQDQREVRQPDPHRQLATITHLCLLL
jgi:hypothetical protein